MDACSREARVRVPRLTSPTGTHETNRPYGTSLTAHSRLSVFSGRGKPQEVPLRDALRELADGPGWIITFCVFRLLCGPLSRRERYALIAAFVICSIGVSGPNVGAGGR